MSVEMSPATSIFFQLPEPTREELLGSINTVKLEEDDRLRAHVRAIMVAVLVMAFVTLAILLSWRPTIPRDRAIAKVIDHFEETGEKVLSVDKTELRSPTEEEQYLIQAFEDELPNLIWYVEVSLDKPGLHISAKVMLNAYTGEILFPIEMLV